MRKRIGVKKSTILICLVPQFYRTHCLLTKKKKTERKENGRLNVRTYSKSEYPN